MKEYVWYIGHICIGLFCNKGLLYITYGICLSAVVLSLVNDVSHNIYRAAVPRVYSRRIQINDDIKKCVDWTSY